MLKKIQYEKKPDKEVLKERLRAEKEELFSRQMKLKEHKLPVIVLVEGFGTAGKGAIIGSVIQSIDPRFFKVSAVTRATPEEKRRPWLHRFFEKIPEEGKFQFYDSGWMDEITRGRLDGSLDDIAYAGRIDSVRRFERTLTDNGYLVFKFFCDITKKEQKKRIKSLKNNIDTAWRIDDYDKWQNRHYDKCREVFDRYFEDTNTPNAPWYMIDASSKKWAELQMLTVINDGLENAMQNQAKSVPIMQNTYRLKKMPLLKDIPLNCSLTQEKYDTELKELQDRLRELHNRLYRMKVPVIIAYEGWDAAGKGGNIKRITGALDPRGFEVCPIASPEPHEKARHFLWRFWTRLPKDGHITIFDRTWYGRVMVERLEGFCSENDWKRAYNEINEFEKELRDWGAVIIKFWVQIDKDTQLKRFTDRQNTPEKQWKITDEDWRNREKWDAYETAVDEMIQKTSTEFAPWHILESNDKKYARIKALRIVVEELEKVLGAGKE
ncbi:MAG: polyphosphate:AMP phosphotransferase [Lachnospiraceae bacterium]|nr:polyphosphate:AMP phosphotransferase [Lachnospiraceae bacterium]